MNDQILAQAASAAAFAKLQAASQAPAQHSQQVTEQNQKLADAIGAAVAAVVQHVKTFAQATGSVQTVVTTAGSAVAQTGTGVGSSIITPGSIV